MRPGRVVPGGEGGGVEAAAARLLGGGRSSEGATMALRIGGVERAGSGREK